MNLRRDMAAESRCKESFGSARGFPRHSAKWVVAAAIVRHRLVAG